MHEHANIREDEDPVLVSRNTRIGLILFAVYFALYSGFMGLTTFAPTIMRDVTIGGINLAILYGFALIIAALLLAFIYLALAGRKIVGH